MLFTKKYFHEGTTASGESALHGPDVCGLDLQGTGKTEQFWGISEGGGGFWAFLRAGAVLGHF